jgi:hypothetical protein
LLTAIPQVLPDQPLTVLWQSTLVDIEPGSRYGYRHDAAAINTTLAIANRTSGVVEFPLILATSDPEPRDSSHLTARVAGKQLEVSAEPDVEWETFAASVRQNAINQGYAPERIDAYLAKLQGEVKRAFKSERLRLEPGEERFIRTHNRKLLKEQEGVFEFRGIFPLPQFLLATGGTLSVAVAVPRSVQKFSVDLVDWTRSFSPQAFGKDPGLPLIGGRYLVSWFWQNDPELYLTYRYANVA